MYPISSHRKKQWSILMATNPEKGSSRSYDSGNFEDMKSYDKTPSFGLPMVTLYHTATQPAKLSQAAPTELPARKSQGNKHTKNQERLVKKNI